MGEGTRRDELSAACTRCGATEDGATTPGCPECEGVVGPINDGLPLSQRRASDAAYPHGTLDLPCFVRGCNRRRYPNGYCDEHQFRLVPNGKIGEGVAPTDPPMSLAALAKAPGGTTPHAESDKLGVKAALDAELDRWECETGEHRDSYPLDINAAYLSWLVECQACGNRWENDTGVCESCGARDWLPVESPLDQAIFRSKRFLGRHYLAR